MSAGFYPDALAHLLDEIDLVRLRLRWLVLRDRLRGRLPRRADLLDRGFISADGVDAALDDLVPTDAELYRLRDAIENKVATLTSKLERSKTVGVTLPLPTLVARFGLSPLSRDILLLSVAAELDGGVRQAIGYLQNDITRQYPDLELAAELFCEGPSAKVRARRELSPEAPLFHAHLLVPGPETSLDEVSVLRMPLRVARRVVDWAAGDPTPDPVLAGVARLDRCPPGPSPLDFMIFGDAELARLREAFARLGEGDPAVLAILSGPEGCGKSTLSWAIGQRLGLSVLYLAATTMERERLPPPASLWARIVREARLQGALLAVDGADRLGRDDLVALARAVDRAPSLPVIIETRTPIAWPGERTTRHLAVSLPGLAERASIWRRELSRRGLPTEHAASLAAKYRVGAGLVQRALAELGDGPHPTLVEAIHNRLAANRDHRLGTLATRITDRPAWDELVLPPETARDLERLAAQFRYRKKLMVDWGFERKMRTGQGISALFQGPPGTGKTMAASVIAGLFDLELFQIDLSRIVSKWLGETEKNLATIFEEAEKAHAILLFDEADSLFAKRTEVQSSNDRHANLEVNFLLQKMDHYQGITLLTSNFGSSIDEAFLRRLSFRIEFPAPSAAERAALWARLSPRELELDDDVDFEALGHHFELSGGHIRNAIFKAAISAAEAATSVSMRHLVDAANIEYRAIGKIVRA